MRKLSPLPLLLLLAACGSSSNDFGIPETKTIDDCVHGEVQVRAGITDAREGKDISSDWLEFSVEVTNNAHKDIVVKSIRIDPRTTESSPYVFETAFREFNQTIPENEERVFELPSTGKAKPRDPDQMKIGVQERLVLVVTVSLEGGESYRCQFENRIPRW
jgi:hypothetical protein